MQPLAQLSQLLNEKLGIYDDERCLACRPAWQRTLVERMHEKGWSLDLRRWAEFPSLAWLAAVTSLWFLAGRMLFGSSIALAVSFSLPLLASMLVSAAVLFRRS